MNQLTWEICDGDCSGGGSFSSLGAGLNIPYGVTTTWTIDLEPVSTVTWNANYDTLKTAC